MVLLDKHRAYQIHHPIEFNSLNCNGVYPSAALLANYAQDSQNGAMLSSSNEDTNASPGSAGSVGSTVGGDNGDPMRKQPMAPHKKRRYKAQMSEVSQDVYYCLVCGDRALGYNFDAMTCESCKAFFRRNAGKDVKVAKCNFTGSCEITVNTRKFCSACRLQKCVDVGMKKDWILNEDQLRARREKTRINRVKRAQHHQRIPCGMMGHHGQSNRKRTISFEADSMCSSSQRSCSPLYSIPVTCSTCLINPDLPPQEWKDRRPLSRVEQELLASIKDALEKVMNNVDIKDHQMILEQASMPKLNSENAFGITLSFINRLITFVKKLSDFNRLETPDKAAIMKGSVLHMTLLRGVIIYDSSTDSWSFRSERLGNKSHSVPTKFLNEALEQVPAGQDLYHRYCKFMREYHTIVQGDTLALTLLLIIELFNPNRAKIADKALVDRLNEKYLMLLKRYLQSRMEGSLSQRTFTEAVHKLTELQTLVDRFNQLLAGLNVNLLNPLLREVFDIEFHDSPPVDTTDPQHSSSDFSSHQNHHPTYPAFFSTGNGFSAFPFPQSYVEQEGLRYPLKSEPLN